jgi:polyhydroxybutyrate depolymerase
LVLHGGGGKPENTMGMDGEYFLKSAKEKGFIVVYPQGNEKKWNDFRDDPTVKEEIKNRDDVGFIRELIRVLTESHSINKSRIYLTGISNGGMMSYRLACEMSSTFREIFPVTANMPQEADTICKPQKPVSITVFNGTEDPLVPYYGGNVKVLGKKHGEVISTDESLRFWSEKAGCKNKTIIPLPKQYPDDSTQVFHHKWDCPNNRVELFEIRGGGHTWPGGIKFLPEMMVGKITKEIEASKVIVERMMEN